MKKLSFFISLISLSQLSNASPALTDEITELWINDNSNSNIAYVSVGQNFSSPCRDSEIRYLVMDLAEPGMKEAYSMALAAFMSDKSVTMAGKGECMGIREKLQYINMIKSFE